jgi:hypothetical protein
MDIKGHVVVMDNYFTSISLFEKLLDKGIYVIGTVRRNHVGLPLELANTTKFNKNVQGTMNWRMHETWRVNCVVWKNKKLMLLLSTYAKLVPSKVEKIPEVPWWNGVERPQIKTSSVHLVYINNMRGVDVANHIRSNYYSQVRTHKLWHRVFFFLWIFTQQTCMLCTRTYGKSIQQETIP